ncbi:MAG: sigma-E factor regulatory protein RseB domain-containing protein, partial [Candidatus Xenobia bacterium]
MLSPVRAQSPDEARIHEIMRKVTTEQATCRGEKSVIFWSQERGSDAVIVKTYRSGDNSRFDYLPSPHRPASIVIENAQQVMYYQPSQKLLVLEDRHTADENDLKLLDLAFANYDWELEGDAMVAGHKTIILKTSRKDSGTVVQRLWIEPKHHVVLRKESYNIRGELAFAAYYTEIDFPDELSPDLFKLTTPQGTKVVERPLPMKLSTSDLKPQLGFDPVLPTQNGQPADLPNGYHLIGMQRETLNGYRAIRLSYSDGL